MGKLFVYAVLKTLTTNLIFKYLQKRLSHDGIGQKTEFDFHRIPVVETCPINGMIDSSVIKGLYYHDIILVMNEELFVSAEKCNVARRIESKSTRLATCAFILLPRVN